MRLSTLISLLGAIGAMALPNAAPQPTTTEAPKTNGLCGSWGVNGELSIYPGQLFGDDQCHHVSWQLNWFDVADGCLCEFFKDDDAGCVRKKPNWLRWQTGPSKGNLTSDQDAHYFKCYVNPLD